MSGGAAQVRERGLAFLRAHGGALDVARAEAAFDAAAVDAVVECVAAALGDGAPGGADPPDPVAAALQALAALGEVGRLGSAPASRTAASLAAIQDAQGAWSTAAGGEADRLRTTALVAGHLARCSAARLRTLAAACAFVESHYSREAVEGAGPDDLAAWACFLANAPTELADAGLQWAGRAFERGLRAGALSPVQAARVLLLADAAALPGAASDGRTIALRLSAAQQADGGWGDPDDPPAHRAADTAHALVALARFAG